MDETKPHVSTFFMPGYTRWLYLAGRAIPERWRRAHDLYADLAGFFWLSCPLCGTMFGGHEWRDIDGKSSSVGEGYAICPGCTRKGLGEEPMLPWATE